MDSRWAVDADAERAMCSIARRLIGRMLRDAGEQTLRQLVVRLEQPDACKLLACVRQVRAEPTTLSLRFIERRAQPPRRESEVRPGNELVQ